MADSMTRRERLRRCYFDEPLDRPAVYSRTGFPPDDPTYDRLKAYFATHTEIKRGWMGTQFESPPPMDVRTEPHSEDWERRIEVLHTPKGDLQRSFLVSLKGQPGMHETYFINNVEHAEKYLSLPMPTIGGEASSFNALDEEVGEAGIATVYLGHNPGGTAAGLCGSENFAILSALERDIIHALCRRESEVLMQRLKFLLTQKVGPYFSMLGEELIVPPLHGPKDFDDFNVRYDKPVVDLIHEAGGRVHIHCHGPIKSCFQGFLEIDPDVLHPFEAPPEGDITAREAKALARDRMCLEGNIQIDRMYEATPEEIREETDQLIADAFDDGKGLIVCPTASPYIRGEGETCFPRYKAMIDAVLARGR